MRTTLRAALTVIALGALVASLLVPVTASTASAAVRVPGCYYKWPTVFFQNQTQLADWCGRPNAWTRNYVADPGVKNFLVPFSTDPTVGMMSPARIKLYGGYGFSQQFLEYAQPTTIPVSREAWSRCDPKFQYVPPGQCPVGHVVYDHLVTSTLPAGASLNVLYWNGGWIALACGNFHYGSMPPTPTVLVTKFADSNRDGSQDNGEGPLSGFRFRLGREADSSVLDATANPDIATGTSDAQGHVAFPITVPPGRYYVEELPRNGWTLTAGQAARKYVDIPFGAGNQTFNVSFGNAPSIVAVKTASAGFTRTYAWRIDKQVDRTRVKQVGGSAQFNYTVTATHDGGVDSDWHVAGTIEVTNYDAFEHAGVSIADDLDDPTATCIVDGGTDATLPAESTVDFPYRCSYTTPPPEPSDHVNTAVVSWPPVSGFDAGPTSTTATAAYTFPAEPTTLVDNCVDVNDTLDGITTALGTTCVGGPLDTNGTTTYTYAREITMPQYGCIDHTNTAEFSTNTTATQGDASVTVTTCGPVYTAAATIGFWRNRNGQAIIQSTGPDVGTCAITGWLEQYAPFQDLGATATCVAVADYTTMTVDNASAAGASLNAMLKAQALATALDVYYSDPAFGGNRLGAPVPIGGVVIDLTKVCSDPLSCSTYVDTSSAFAGAPGMTVAAILSYASSQSGPGAGFWYANDKSIQELAKDTFDAINNQVAFAYP